MSGFPTGVAVVSALDPHGIPRGMTCSSLCSVTLNPPTLLVCLRNGSPTLDAVLRRETFTVNFLHEKARSTAELFASGAPGRFEEVRWEAGPGAGGPHLVEDAQSAADCLAKHTEQAGDHTVVFGQISEIVLYLCTPRPLLYGLRRYSAWTDTFPAPG
ncbi:flavin reductase family protein [Streptomyces roseifaciens]